MQTKDLNFFAVHTLCKWTEEYKFLQARIKMFDAYFTCQACKKEIEDPDFALHIHKSLNARAMLHKYCITEYSVKQLIKKGYEVY